MNRKEWFKRKFNQTLDPETLPNILERLSGTPARIEEKIRSIDATYYDLKLDDQWSIKENTGHLSDLEPLWMARIEDLVDKREILTEADLSNQKTHQANHNQRSIKELLDEFRGLRGQHMAKLTALNSPDLEKFSLHPRLNTPMRIIDLAFFVAEHDDHHLAQISFIAKQHSSSLL